MSRALEEASKQLSALGATTSNKDERMFAFFSSGYKQFLFTEIRRLRDTLIQTENKLRESQNECELLRNSNREMRAQVDAETSQIDSLQTQLENMREE